MKTLIRAIILAALLLLMPSLHPMNSRVAKDQTRIMPTFETEIVTLENNL